MLCPIFKLDVGGLRLSRSSDTCSQDTGDVSDAKSECSDTDHASGFDDNEHSSHSACSNNHHIACSTRGPSNAWDALVGTPPAELWGTQVSPAGLRAGGMYSVSPKQALFRTARTTEFAPPDASGMYSSSLSPKQALFRTSRTTGFMPLDATTQQASSSAAVGPLRPIHFTTLW